MIIPISRNVDGTGEWRLKLREDPSFHTLIMFGLDNPFNSMYLTRAQAAEVGAALVRWAETGEVEEKNHEP